MLNQLSKKNKNENKDQAENFFRNNHIFGDSIDRTRQYTDRRFDRKPRLKVNIENGRRYLDKAKFLTKFSCFDGYMQYVDSHWDGSCQGVDFD